MYAIRLVFSLVAMATASAIAPPDPNTFGSFPSGLPFPPIDSSFNTPAFPNPGGVGVTPVGPPQQVADGFPSPTGSASGWDIITSGLVRADATTVWNAMQDPRVAMSIAFRHFAYQVQKSGRTIHVILNSAEELVFSVSQTNNNNRYHHYTVFGHTRGIFDVEPNQLNIRRSQLVIHVEAKTASTCQIVVGLYLAAGQPTARNKTLLFLQGFLAQIVDHYQMVFGVADCGTDHHRETLGICNNLQHPTYGASETALQRLRINSPSYSDGMSKPASANISPRRISNIVCDQGTDEDNASNAMHVTDLFVIFGQFIDHDVGITPAGSFAAGKQPLFSFGHEKFRERFDISVPADDPDFRGAYRKDLLPFERSIYVRQDGQNVYPRVPPNSITAYLDLSQVYGADRVRAKVLREFDGGRLKISGSAPGFLPFNGDRPGGVGINLENAPDAGKGFYVAGDIRAQENAVLASLHALWLREHNKVARELDRAFRLVGQPKSDEELFQYARDICVAEYQSIVYSEWLPLLLGKGVVSPNSYQYDPNLSTSLDAFFTTASFRFGHSMVNNILWKKNSSGAITKVKLEDVFFNPSSVNANNFASYLFGAACHEARELDAKVVDALRSKLFTKNGGPSHDLVALNIQRGRDHGLPSYNKAREAFYLPPLQSFSQISSSTEIQQKLKEAYYNDIFKIDAFVGGLCEDKPAGRLLGDLFHRSVADQFRRLRDGDRLFYKKPPFPPILFSIYPRLEEIVQDRVTLATILHRNTDISPAVLAAHGQGPRSLFKSKNV